MTSTDTTDKPFMIDKRRVYEAYKAVKSSKGGAGVDGQTIEAFEADLKGNLYRIWNRMSSGSYFPPPVRAVSIPKKSGGERILGVPTVGDRIAQMVVKQFIEPELDPIFLKDSYGYRPGKSALDAVGVTRERCWKYDWNRVSPSLQCGGRPGRISVADDGVVRGRSDGDGLLSEPVEEQAGRRTRQGSSRDAHVERRPD